LDHEQRSRCRLGERQDNEQLIRSLYSLAEGKAKNTPNFVPLFTVDGYFYDVAVGKKYFGNEIGATVGDFPYRTAAEHSEGIDAIFGEKTRKRVNRENALRILPGPRST
jgi:hypothetical protein